VFAFATLGLVALASTLGNEKVGLGPAWTRWVGSSAVLYSLAYPHFLELPSFVLYLLTSPLGLIPCPSLSAVIGFTLLADGFRSRLWTFALGGFGLFYGLFGVMRLGVWLDVGLVFFSLSLIALGIRGRASGWARLSSPLLENPS
jgi:hypothetical protein